MTPHTSGTRPPCTRQSRARHSGVTYRGIPRWLTPERTRAGDRYGQQLSSTRMIEMRPLGRTGVQVSSLCLGAMNFGGPADEDASEKMLLTALDAGINFIDTAD